MTFAVCIVMTFTFMSLASAAQASADSATPTVTNFPLAGQTYEGYVNGSKVAAYNMVWTEDGRLWQPDLPSKKNRQTHTDAIKLLAGWGYTFNGVESTLRVDLDCDSKLDYYAANTEDGKVFSIPADAGVIENGLRVVWATVWSSTPSGGTEILAIGPIGAK